MQIPILSGIYTDSDSDFRTSYPRNLVPVPKSQGISEGYLRPSDGIQDLGQGEGPGLDRASVNWDEVCYRVMGTKFVRQNSNGSLTEIADVGGVDQSTLEYSFDYLGISSSGLFYLYDGVSTVTQVTDPDLGTVVDFIWVDGYFMTTDGENLVVTELNDPFQVNPNKFGSSEADPDPIKALLKIKNEPHALNRYTIEAFTNVGGTGFPFERVEGAQIQKGTVGTYSCCVINDTLAFMGGGRHESISVWLGVNGSAVKIATREIDQILNSYSFSELEKVVFETYTHEGFNQILIRLPDQTLVYDLNSSRELQRPVWFILTSSLEGNGKYRAYNRVWCYAQWNVADPVTNKIGILTDSISTQWGDSIGWDFSTPIIYNEGNRGIVHELELVSLTGRTKLGENPTIWTSYSEDGLTFSNEKAISAGKAGQRNIRLCWFKQGMFRNWRIQKFRGNSESHMSIARLEARIEGLVW